jgi:hypothetical protein
MFQTMTFYRQSIPGKAKEESGRVWLDLIFKKIPIIVIRYQQEPLPLLSELWRGSRMAKPVKVLRMWGVLVPLSSRGVASYLEMLRSRCVLILRAMTLTAKLKVSVRTKMAILPLVVWLGTLGVETLGVHGSTD